MARVALSVLALAALASPARADEGMLPNGGTFEFQDLYVHLGGDPDFTQPNDLDRDQYFNLAHCVCAKAGAGDEQDFQLAMKINGATAPINRPADVWTGAECDNDQTRPTNCKQITDQAIGDLGTLQTAVVRKTFKIGDALAPVGVCQPTESNGHIWVMSDLAGGGTYDYAVSYELAFDTQGPPAPANPVAAGGEAAIQIDWDAPVDRSEDVAYYQALCARADNGAPALAAPSHEARYQTANRLCGANATEVLTPIDNPVTTARGAFGPTVDAAPIDAAPIDAAPTPDAAPLVVPEGLQRLDPSFICGEVTAPASSMRIDGLENDTPYYVVVVAVDLSGNASGVAFQNPLTPLPVTDFWEDLHDKGSGVEGGFCLINETYGDGGWPTTALRAFRDDTLARTAFGRWLTAVYYDVSAVLAPIVRGSLAARVIAAIVLAPLVVVALAWHVLTLPGLVALVLAAVWWRRRHRATRAAHTALGPRLAAALVLVAVVGLAGAASAQGSMDPYWSDDLYTDDTADELLDPHWNVGLRVGPYVPAIDAQAGANPGPYEQMFGDKTVVLPMLDVHWLALRGGYGQVGIGGSIGAFWRKAKAYKAGTDPSDPMRPRSDGDWTTFRLIPIEATATYRFTGLDDNYGIPVVPYARAGLGYYVWWVGAPSGSSAVVYEPDGCDPAADGCKTNRARGASLGIVAAVGLAVRAERIDPSAARSMQQGGVEHAGFYAELSLAKVDGFGSDKRLAVGDKTWFVGVNFEF